jgi:DegV family protein with EDD domain
MSEILIMTDSACDLDKETVESLGIKVIPFTITFGDKSFKETFDKSTHEVYDMMQNFDDIPKTAQITAFEFEENFNECYNLGYTDIIYVGINSKGSSTYNNSIMAKNSFFENHPEAKGKINIYNIDSKCYTGVYGYPITEAVKKIKKGESAEAIVAYFEEWFSVAAVYAVPITLKYARKSGRISAAAAFAGEMLGLKPIIEFADGGTSTVDKVRGEKNIIPKMLACLEKKMVPQAPYMMVCGKDDTVAKELEKELFKKYGRKAEAYYCVGAAVAANIGCDLVGVICRRK